MGHDCGFLALMSGLATGAERVYLPEEGISLRAAPGRPRRLRSGFALGKRRGLVLRGERRRPAATRPSFIESLFEHESGGLFDVRSAILGHVQQGGASLAVRPHPGHPADRRRPSST